MKTSHIYSRILALGIPILVGQLGSIVVGFADTTMVGQYSTEALASASFVNNLFNVVIFALMGFSYGLTPLIGALYSARRDTDIGHMLRAGIIANVTFGLLLTAIMTLVYFNLHRLGQPEELLPIIRPYYLIFLSGIMPLALFNVFAQWAYAINRTRMPMWIILISNVINIAGNYLLIYGNCGAPELGLTGAGVATLTARLFCMAAIVAVFMTSRDYAPYRRGVAAPGSHPARRIMQVVRTSLPVSLQMTFEAGSFTAAAVMAGWIGTLALASYQVMVILGTLGFCVYYSIAAAVSVLVSNAAGLADRVLMRRVAYAGYVIVLSCAAVACLIFIFAGPTVFHIFTSDPQVIAAAMALIVPLLIYQLGDATQITFANALRGTANVMPMLWISFLSYVVIGMPATYLLAFTARLGTYGIVLSFSVSLFIAAALFLRCFLRTTAPQTARN